MSGRDLSVGSPATNGRPGAAYGGFFWRAPKEAAVPVVFGAESGADDEESVHGARSDWVALAGEGWTLVFAGATETTRRDPWFVGPPSTRAWARPSPTTAGCRCPPGRRSYGGGDCRRRRPG
ncbi:hypothetical protein SNARM312S_07222 [Streptomyces narbonensis]